MDRGGNKIHQSADTHLVMRAKKGEPGAFEELFLKYRDQIYSLTFRMTGNSSDAEDLCQEVFLSAFRKISSFQQRSSFSTWLYRIGINRSKDFLRKKKRTPEIVQDRKPGEDWSESLPHRRPESSEPELAAISSETKEVVQGALKRLPDSLKIPLVLHQLEGLEYREVAKLLHLPVGTVKSRIFRARLQLAEILEGKKEQLCL